jgi:hypothetical protein
LDCTDAFQSAAALAASQPRTVCELFDLHAIRDICVLFVPFRQNRVVEVIDEDGFILYLMQLAQRNIELC